MALNHAYDTEAFLAVAEAVPDRRVELLDGEIYVMNRPGAPHQYMLGELYRWFRESLPRGWMPLIEVEVIGRIAGRESRLVPDLSIFQSDTASVADELHLNDVHLAVEILSPSTRDRDLGVKADVYALAGVSWYWIVDPIARTLEVRRLGDDSRWMIEPTLAWPSRPELHEF